MTLYDDLLALSAEPETHAQAQTDVAVQSPETDAWEVVQATAERLELGEVDGQTARRAIIEKLNELQANIEAVWTSFEKVEERVERSKEEQESVDEAKTDTRIEVPVGLMTDKEWSSLVTHCVSDPDLTTQL